MAEDYETYPLSCGPSVPGPDISAMRLLAPDDTTPAELVGNPELALIGAREAASLAIQAGGTALRALRVNGADPSPLSEVFLFGHMNRGLAEARDALGTLTLQHAALDKCATSLLDVVNSQITAEDIRECRGLWLSVQEMFGYQRAVEVTEAMVNTGISQLEATIERLRPEHMQLQALEWSQR